MSSDLERRGPGQPTKLTPDRVARIIEAVELGCYLDAVADYAGVSVAAIMGWAARGRAEARRRQQGAPERERENRYLEFFNAFTRARAVAEVDAVRAIRGAMGDDWRAALAWLERGPARSRWGRKDRVEVTGEGGGPIAITARSVIEQKLGDMGARLREASNVIDLPVDRDDDEEEGIG